jgi:phosphoenolpyruvate carboxykinase (ATP)
VQYRLDDPESSLTENTRAAYPAWFIHDAVVPGTGGHPTNIFLLTCDAFGVLPPLARLTPEQTMYHFLSGYTAKLAGTERGLGAEPKATFSSCFGAPFLALHPSVYAEMLGERITRHKVSCWLMNTGWTGGSFGKGNRLRLPHTRALLRAALTGKLDGIPMPRDPVFGLDIPTACPDVPNEILKPRETWADKAAYDTEAARLAELFRKNFEQFEGVAAGVKERGLALKG